ncbi:MAG: RelA/SpoT family protein [Thermodesulfobacteriota bacterium]
MIRLNDIIDKITSYNDLSNNDVDLIKKAYIYSAKVHAGQKRVSGEPYLSHPLEVSSILADLKLDVSTIATGLLHDTLEDTLATLEDVEELFGNDIAFLVDSTTKISKLQYVSKLETQAESFRKLFLATAKDIRVVLIKLADRLHNMRTLKYLDDNRRKRISAETMDIYAPLAHRLGINWIYTELEDLSFQHSNPKDYKKVLKLVSNKKKEWRDYLLKVKNTLTEKLNDIGIEADVTGRFKHNYGIYRKMKLQSLEIEKVYDILAFRIITKDENDCYQALGAVHNIWTPVPGRFKDYIALPKTNGYQSLHTTVLGPLGEQVEIQIRTMNMHEFAEYGVAAHWNYKENTNGNHEMYTSLRKLVEHKDIEDPTEFLEAIKGELISNVLYVFTPDGDLIELPEGSTPVDFAYAIHSEIGDHCSSAMVNRSLVSLDHKLKTGDTIEIVTIKDKNPNRDWLSFVITSKAKTKIRLWLRNKENQKSEEIGKMITERKLKEHGMKLNEIIKGKNIVDTLQNLNLNSIEDFYRAVGFGNISANELIKILNPETELISEEKELRIDKIFQNISKDQFKSAVKVKGFNDIMTRFAKCCSPLPGELISGYITRGRGITIHKHDCPYLLEVDPQRKIEVDWDNEFIEQMPTKISVVCIDKPGILSKLTKAISASGVNIIRVEMDRFEVEKAKGRFEISVNDIKQLNSVINSLQNLKGVIDVERVFESVN